MSFCLSAKFAKRFVTVNDLSTCTRNSQVLRMILPNFSFYTDLCFSLSGAEPKTLQQYCELLQNNHNTLSVSQFKMCMLFV